MDVTGFKVRIKSIGFVTVLVALSVISAMIVFLDFDRPAQYAHLPLMPVVYCVLVILFFYLFDCIPTNFGATLILCFECLRMVVTPMFITLSGYYLMMPKNAEVNMPKAIGLMVYECIVVFAVMAVMAYRSTKKGFKRKRSATSPKKYKNFLLLLLLLTIAMIAVAPEILKGYRTIFSLTDSSYTSVEMSTIINTQSSGFISRFAMVLGMNLAIVLRILIPSMIIIRLSKRKQTIWLSLLMALTPFLIVDGTIGRSVYFSVVLFYLIYYLYDSKAVRRLLVTALVFAVAFVAFYWAIRYTVSNSRYTFFEYVSRILNSYFSGLFMVSGSFNLSGDLQTRAVYFAADILKSFPFGNTLFRMSGVEYFQTFFNSVNATYGMIPPCVGVGRFYFGTLLAPLYSAVFAGVSFLQGDKAKNDDDPYRRITHLIESLFCALSFNMYAIQTTYTLLFWVVLPSFIISWLSKRRKTWPLMEEVLGQ